MREDLSPGFHEASGMFEQVRFGSEQISVGVNVGIFRCQVGSFIASFNLAQPLYPVVL